MQILKIKEFWKKEKTNLIILFLIIIVASIFRLYNFEEWFHFRNDQARDAIMASRVLDGGLENLRLLGPKAGGSALHLGPIFYYFQAFSCWIFQSKEPPIMAIPDLLFSIAIIPLLYFFIRNLFSNKTSLSITAIYAFSYVAIQYSRFAWNPNSLPFWSLLLVFSIYKVAVLKNREKAGWFLILAGFSYAVASQLHFVALAGLPIFIFIFWLKYLPKKINWKFWLGSILAVFVLYIPVLASEIITDGNNSKQFIHTVENRGKEKKDKTIFEKITKTTENYGKYYSFFLTSINDNEVESIYSIGKVFIFGSIIFLFLVWKKKFIKVNSKKKKLLYYLFFAFFLGSLIISYKLSHEINKPRYWFAQAIIPFIFFGFFLESLFNSKRRCLTRLGWSLVFIIIALNLSAVINIFLNFSNREDGENFGRITTSTTNRYNRIVPLSDMRRVVDYIYEQNSTGQKVCLSSPSGYGASYQYLFQLKYPELEVVRNDSYFSDQMRKNCNIFLINIKEKTKEKQQDILHMDFKTKNSFRAGVIRVYDIEPLENDLSDEYRIEFEAEKKIDQIEKLEEEPDNEVETIPMKVWADFFNR